MKIIIVAQKHWLNLNIGKNNKKMINTIIKRDGTKEQFSAEKINGWGEWAAENLGKYVNWSDVVLDTVARLPINTSAVDLHETLIQTCLDKKSWSYNRMAGRLLVAKLRKDLYNDDIPHIQKLHQEMVKDEILYDKFYNAFSDKDYEAINSMLNHEKDLTYAQFQIQQNFKKYSLQDKVNKKYYETPQFVFMRVAMQMALNKPNRLEHIKNFYYLYSNGIINIPTPYFANSGTKKYSYISCCLYSTNDTVQSLAAGDHIAYTMTYSSAGIGSSIRTRTLNDSVRGGIIKHQGKLPYYRALVGAIKANLQNGRGGAATVTYYCYDPEVLTIQSLKHPLTPQSKQIRGIDYCMAFNRFFVEKAANNEDIALFSLKEAPEIYEAISDKDQIKFEKLYDKAIKEKRYHSFVSAREILVGALVAAIDTGRHYYLNLTESNNHTPFKEPIIMTNLCTEILLPVTGFNSVTELYKDNYSETDGEIALCALAGLTITNIKDDKEYAKAAYYALLMIHTAIHESSYVFPQVAATAKSRNSAGVGILGLAHHLAKNKLSWSSQEGRNEIHKVSERHYWHLLNASLKMSKEFGLAEWIDKTKWPEGWLPIDTYNKNIDSIVTVENQYDWESLRKEIIANGGIHNSVLVAIAPSESSSISTGTTNAVYPVRMLNFIKGNDNDVLYYSVPDSEKLEKHYELAYDVNTVNMKMNYGILQKFTDQGISADDWKALKGDAKIETSELLQDFFAGTKYGNKARYYINTETAKGIGLSDNTLNEEKTIEELLEELELEDDDCEGCKL